MKQAKIAEYFGVSLTTLQNWKRQNCPISGDLAEIIEWKVRRELEQLKMADILPNLPKYEAEMYRRGESLNEAIAWVNAMKPGIQGEPGLLKVSLCLGIEMERALLDLPRRIIAEAKAETLPEDVYRIVFAAIDRAKGNDEQEDDSPPRSRRKREAVGPEPAAEVVR